MLASAGCIISLAPQSQGPALLVLVAVVHASWVLLGQSGCLGSRVEVAAHCPQHVHGGGCFLWLLMSCQLPPG